MEMQVYIANLGKYNEGELVGAWFTPPIDYEEIKECIGLNGENEEYAIHDYKLPFEINEYTSISEINGYTSISEINRLCEFMMELEDSPILDEIKEIQGM